MEPKFIQLIINNAGALTALDEVGRVWVYAMVEETEKPAWHELNAERVYNE